MLNNRVSADTRRLFSGKDALVLDADTGEILANVDSYQVQANFTNASFQPLGSALQTEFMTGYSVTITITECVIADSKFIRDVFRFFSEGRHGIPMWNFSSVIEGYDGSQSRYTFFDCVPSGNLDLHNFQPGDVIKRQWSLRVNGVPNLQKLLSYARNERD